MILKLTIAVFCIINLHGQNSVVQQFSKAFADVAQSATPAVVTIISDKIVKMPKGAEDFYFFFSPNQNPSQRKEFKTNALGSGVIIDSENGYILTNNHVVEDMDAIRVKLFDKRLFEAEIVGADPKSDLAVLRIDAKGLIELKLGNSDNLRVGEWVMAVGSPFTENLSHTVTTGIVSALGRNNIIRGQGYENFIQTDAAINPGNSGGALLNMSGQLIGINTAIATGGYEKSNRGVGFAIPSNMANQVMKDLINKGYVVRSWMGVFIQELDSEAAKALELDSPNGALVTQVVDGSPASKGGLKEGDVILKFQKTDITSPSNLRNVVSLTAPGVKSDVTIFRNGKIENIKVILEELEEDAIITARKTEQKTILGLKVEELSRKLLKKYSIDDADGKIIITFVDPESEAFEKGIREGDIIKRVGTLQVDSLKDFNDKIKKTKSRGSLLILVKSLEGSSRFVTLSY